MLRLLLWCDSFAQGSNGIYFGGKDFLLSEVSGNFSVSAGVIVSKGKGGTGEKVARLSIRAGCPAAAVKCEPAPDQMSIMCVDKAF